MEPPCLWMWMWSRWVRGSVRGRAIQHRSSIEEADSERRREADDEDNCNRRRPHWIFEKGTPVGPHRSIQGTANPHTSISDRSQHANVVWTVRPGSIDSIGGPSTPGLRRGMSNPVMLGCAAALSDAKMTCCSMLDRD